MSQPHNAQPPPTPHMTSVPSPNASSPTAAAAITTTEAAPHRPQEDSFVRKESEKYLGGAADQAGSQSVQFVTANPPQAFEDAKAQAEGMWAKYCGCFASLS